jgi:hypothetical protein
MRHTSTLTLYLTTLIALSTLFPSPSNASIPKPPTRGFAILASTIVTDISPEALAEVVRQGRYSPVVVDWAWVTYHFERTDFKAVNKFLGLMAEQKMPVAGMYRPRFLSSPTVATQIGKDGKAGDDHAEICYSDPAAWKWGISWGEKILEKCPSFRRSLSTIH